MPRCDSEAMSLHLAEISAEVAPGKIGVVLLDQAGWHLSSKLVVPKNIVIVPLPAKCPELNPQENLWQFMRDMSGRRRLSRGFRKVCERLGAVMSPACLRGRDRSAGPDVSSAMASLHFQLAALATALSRIRGSEPSVLFTSLRLHPRS